MYETITTLGNYRIKVNIDVIVPLYAVLTAIAYVLFYYYAIGDSWNNTLGDIISIILILITKPIDVVLLYFVIRFIITDMFRIEKVAK